MRHPPAAVFTTGLWRATNAPFTMLTLNAFLFTLFLTSSLGQPLCPDSTFDPSLDCLCKAGTYKSFPSSGNPVSCIPCHPGSFRASPGAVHEDQCLPCPAGRFQRRAGATRCFRCTRGAWSAPGSCVCAICPPRTRHRSTLDDRNYMCRRRERGLSPACVRCGNTEISVLVDGQRRECRPCLGVRTVESDDPSQCQSCPPGFSYRRGSFEFCRFNFTPLLRCPIGQMPSRSEVGVCDSCPSGTFMSRAGGLSCGSCRFGLGFGGTSLGISPAGCRVEGRGCPTNTFEGRDGECRACRPGERFNRRRLTCLPCREGQVSAGGLETRCQRCPAGKVPNERLSGCVCRPGTISDGEGGCLECPIGTMWSTSPMNDRPGDFADISGCRTCVGTVQNQTGSQSCETCPVDTIPNRERTACVPCPSGFHSPLHLRELNRLHESRQQCLDEDQCPPGFSRIEGMFRGLCAQEECEEGQFRLGLTGSTCASCSRGFRYDPSRGQCIDCGRLRTSDGGLSTTCRRCPPRSGNGFELGCECVGGAGIQNGRCLRCRAGYISRAFGPPINNRKCLKCPPGTFQPTPGSNGLHNVCMRCPANSTTPMEGGASACTPCPTGMIVFPRRDGISENVCRPPFPTRR